MLPGGFIDRLNLSYYSISHNVFKRYCCFLFEVIIEHSKLPEQIQKSQLIKYFHSYIYETSIILFITRRPLAAVMAGFYQFFKHFKSSILASEDGSRKQQQKRERKRRKSSVDELSFIHRSIVKTILRDITLGILRTNYITSSWRFKCQDQDVTINVIFPSCRCDHDYSLRGDARGGAIEVVS